MKNKSVRPNLISCLKKKKTHKDRDQNARKGVGGWWAESKKCSSENRQQGVDGFVGNFGIFSRFGHIRGQKKGKKALTCPSSGRGNSRHKRLRSVMGRKNGLLQELRTNRIRLTLNAKAWLWLPPSQGSEGEHEVTFFELPSGMCRYEPLRS